MSPAKLHVKQQQEKHSLAVDAIETDQYAQELSKAFGVNIDPQWVKNK